MTPLQQVQQTEALFKAMRMNGREGLGDLVAYRNCPVAFLDNFERAMLKKYNILAVA